MKYFFQDPPNSISLQTAYGLDFLPHLHSHIEMGVIYSGTCSFFCDGKKYALSRGDFYISFPNVIHSYSDSENILTTLAIFPPDTVPEFRGVFNSRLPESPVITFRGTAAEVLFPMLDAGGSQEYMRGLLLAVCADILPRLALRARVSDSADTLRSILLYIDANFTSPLCIDTLSEALHISRSHISHVFRSKLDTTFTQYLNAKRIGCACDMLRHGGCSVTDAALGSGFETVRTFNRAFLRETGVTPREFRSRQREKQFFSKIY